MSLSAWFVIMERGPREPYRKKVKHAEEFVGGIVVLERVSSPAKGCKASHQERQHGCRKCQHFSVSWSCREGSKSSRIQEFRVRALELIKHKKKGTARARRKEWTQQKELLALQGQRSE
jgi:hypothetical protein